MCVENLGYKIQLKKDGSDGNLNYVRCKNFADEASNKWLMFDLGQIIPVYKIYINTNYVYSDLLNVFEIHIGKW